MVTCRGPMSLRGGRKTGVLLSLPAAEICLGADYLRVEPRAVVIILRGSFAIGRRSMAHLYQRISDPDQSHTVNGERVRIIAVHPIGFDRQLEVIAAIERLEN